MGLHLLVYRGVQLREHYVNIRNCWDVHSSYDYRCELSGHVKGSTLYSQYCTRSVPGQGNTVCV